MALDEKETKKEGHMRFKCLHVSLLFCGQAFACGVSEAVS